MKKKKIIRVAIIVVLILCLSLIVINNKNNKQQVINNQNDKNNIAQNYAEKIKIIQGIDNLEFSNVNVQMKNALDCEITAEVLNKSNEIIEAHTIRIKATDDSGKINEVFAGNISSIPAGEKRILSATIKKDLTSITNIEFEIIK